MEKLVREQRIKGSNNLYIRSTLKEYLQTLILEYIYTSKEYNSNFIFTGGTCLRHVFGLERLSEDLDFDLLEDIDSTKLAENIQKYFVSNMKYNDFDIAVKQKGRQILLKFPCLKKLGLVDENESNLLHIKMDLLKVVGSSYELEKTAKSIFGLNFVVLHYDLPSLFATKITALLTRNLLFGKEDREIIKGRDFFDLLWYLKNDVKVNLAFVQERLGEKVTEKELKKRIEEKVRLATTKFKNDFKNDLLPFIENPEFVLNYIENYASEFERYERK
jgi:predicted nucleotidyltransferase component of viral defense system